MNPYNGEILTDENGDIIKIQGMSNAMDYIRNNKQIYDFIYNFINSEALGQNNSNNLTIDAELDQRAIDAANENAPMDDIVLRVEAKAAEDNDEEVLNV